LDMAPTSSMAILILSLIPTLVFKYTGNQTPVFP
jgi:hypothetical protein